MTTYEAKRFEQLLKEDAFFREMYAKMPPWPKERTKAKPKPALVSVVSEKLAAAARANPDSVRISARADDDTIVVDRPRRSDIVEVVEVDAQGRPKLARAYDAASNTYGDVEFKEGYRAGGSAQSVYDPIERFEKGLGK